MITLITGLPGNGKTLYTIDMVKAKAEKENRPVFYSGIPELTLDWELIDPEKWFECPHGAIIVIDECQRIFRPRGLGKSPPDYVEQLETHRHQGYDIFLLTQHPMLCDNAVRRLAGQHFHAMRKFGMERSRLHEWSAVRENCDKPAGRVDSIKHDYKFNKAIYGLYKSAEQHNVKRRIPMRFWFVFVIFPAILIAAGYYYYKRFTAEEPAQAQIVEVKNMTSSSSASPIGRVGVKNVSVDRLADAKQWAWKHTPRIKDLPHTAPRYDEMTEPTKVPYPAMCIQSKSRCLCYSQQATRLDMSQGLCMEIVRKGYFLDFDTQRASRSNEPVNEGAKRVL